MDTVTQKQQTHQCQVLTESGQVVEDNSGHSNTEQTEITEGKI